MSVELIVMNDELITFRSSDLYRMLGQFGLTPFAADQDCAPRAAAMVAEVDRIRVRQP